MSGPDTMAASAVKRQILDRVEKWLDTALEPEAPPEGIDPELLAEILNPPDISRRQDYDAAAAWSTITALTQEVKLQGRAFKDLAEAVNAQSARAAEELRASAHERDRDAQREAESRCRREILGELLDLRDSLERGLRAAEASRASRPQPHNWLARLAGPPPETQDETRAALLKGYALSLERLDAMLSGWNVRPIESLSRPFDPVRMNAVDIEESAAVADGTVTEIYRTGYEWNGQVFRAAQVRVARAPK